MEYDVQLLLLAMDLANLRHFLITSLWEGTAMMFRFGF